MDSMSKLTASLKFHAWSVSPRMLRCNKLVPLKTVIRAEVLRSAR